MRIRKTTIVLALGLLVAFCTPARTDSVNTITNPNLKRYTARELERGAPALRTTSRVLYREALEVLERDDWEAAREKLLLAASLSGDYADPLFTLARVELLHAHPDFMFHMIEGITRLFRSFRSQSYLALNAGFLLIVSTLGALLVTLAALLLKYWPLIDHKLREGYGKKAAFPPAGWIGFLIVIALLVMRLGIALYAALLIIVLWPLATRKEKGAVLVLALFLCAASFTSGYINALVPAADPGSITSRLSLVSERSVDTRTVRLVREINDPAFAAEREFVLGTFKYRLAYLEEAKQHLLAAVSNRKNFAEAYLNLGNVYFMQGDYNKAIAGYQNVIALDSTNAVAHYNIGQTYIKKMLFAESSSALKRANALGIDNYRSLHPAAVIRGLTIYEAELGAYDLWAIALREGKAHGGRIISDVLRPYLLFPFHRLWILLVASLLVAFIVAGRLPPGWKAFRCENCSKPACPQCAHTDTGLSLCKGCAGTIEGLTSVKVMEALLRHRRQKILAKSGSRSPWKVNFFPGAPYIYFDKALTGALVALVNTGVLVTLLWNGFYFKNPSVIVMTSPLWKFIAPPVVMILGYLLFARVRIPSESRNYRILPPEMYADRHDPKQGQKEVEKKSEELESLLNSL